MYARMAEGRIRAFLKAVEETGNQTLAAERARVSRSWVVKRRSEDAAFDEAVRAAVAAARERLGARGEAPPPRRWGHLDGEELAVRGTGGSGGGKRVQIARARVHQWSPALETRFLQVLAATCNARAACGAVGMSKGSAYARRGQRPDFARRWEEALARGYERVGFGLTANALRLLDPEYPADLPPDLPMPPMTVSDAVRVLRIYERQGRTVRARARR